MPIHQYCLILCLLFFSCQDQARTKSFDVLVLGEGTGAITAAIQASRSGAHTLLVNPQPWLGGMLTAAGVSATDGNHKLHAGLWAEWRQLLREHYGGADSLFTGWVSNTMFEPSVGEQYWRQLAYQEKKLTIYDSVDWAGIEKNELWTVEIPSKNIDVTAKILIDGTELGDVAAQVGVDYNLGMDDQSSTNESIAPETKNDIVQDFTYVAILKNFGDGPDQTIPKPKQYDRSLYDCSCQHNCDDPSMHPCQTMLDYGKLPNDKYMINWPFHGNDFCANVIELTAEERQAIYQKSREHTLGFVYYIQTELGYKNLGLARDEFPTKDNLALIPYHREGRRIKGISQVTVNHIKTPYQSNLYKSGIAVGDYPIDHHHAKCDDVPDINFPSVPSFSIPIGSLIPKDVDDILIADKAISVSNIANGSTRLQPVIIQVGQAAGIIAAYAAKHDISLGDIDIRDIQKKILEANGYLMPFIDVSPDNSFFVAAQKLGATGILKGRPQPYKWANQTWFDPDSLLHVDTISASLIEYDARFADLELLGKYVTQVQTQDIVSQFCSIFDLQCKDNQDKIIPYNFPVTRAEFAELLTLEFNLFDLKKIDFDGHEK